MATKKQKREAGEARQILHREELARNNAKALKQDQDFRKKKEEATKAAMAKKKLRESAAEKAKSIAGRPVRVSENA